MSRQVGESEIKETEESINEFIGKLCDDINAEFIKLCQKKTEELNSEIDDVMKSEQAEFFFHSVAGAMDGKIRLFQKKDVKAAKAKFDSLKTVVERISGKVVKLAVKEGGKAGGIFIQAGDAAGGQLHKIVYEVGKRLGHNFKPWEAVNIAKNIGNFAKFLGPLAQVLGIIFDIKGAMDESKQAQKIQEAQQEARKLFIDTHDDIELQYNEQIDKVLNEYDNIIAQINSSKEKVNDVLKANDAMTTQLAELRKELIEIQSEIF